jgi:hypothetical protein
MGEARARHIQEVVQTARAALEEQGTSEDMLRQQTMPYIGAAERIYPHLMIELREMARAAGVPFEIVFRLNCYESRPQGAEVRTAPATPSLPAKDPGVLPATNGAERVPSPEEVSASPAPAPSSGNGGCTSVASRGPAGVVVGHTEDSSPQAIEGLYLLDATLLEPDGASGRGRRRFLALNYAQTLPGCAAAVNDAGLVVLVDALPDPDRRVGAPRHFVSRALLDQPTIDAAIEHLRQTERGGGWNYLLVQDQRIVNVETTATRVVVDEVPLGGGRADEGHDGGHDGAQGQGTYAHSNHYLDMTLAADTAEPRPNSVARLARARALVAPAMDVAAMKALLSDRQGFPDSICRERTIGAFIADTGGREIQVCWGEPDEASWTSYRY